MRCTSGILGTAFALGRTNITRESQLEDCLEWIFRPVLLEMIEGQDIKRNENGFSYLTQHCTVEEPPRDLG